MASESLHNNPDSMEFKYQFGIMLYKNNYYVEALDVFLNALNKKDILHRDNSYKIKIKEALNNCVNELCEGWNCLMLNDQQRNNAFFNGMKMVKYNNDLRVLDIGAGTGLLSFMANKLNYHNIYSCESNPFMCHTFKSLLQKSVGKISFIPQSFMDVQIKDSINLLVIEMFDAGFFGEALVPVLKHFFDNFNTETNKFNIIPHSAILKFALIESSYIEKQCRFENTSKYGKSTCIAKSTMLSIGEPYLTEKLCSFLEYGSHKEFHKCKELFQIHEMLIRNKSIKYLTQGQSYQSFSDFLEFILNDKNLINRLQDKSKENEPITQISLNVVREGTCHAVCLAFDLCMIKDASKDSTESNSSALKISTLDPRSCWEQAFFPLDNPVFLQISQDRYFLQVFYKTDENYLEFELHDKNQIGLLNHPMPTSINHNLEEQHEYDFSHTLLHSLQKDALSLFTSRLGQKLANKLTNINTPYNNLSNNPNLIINDEHYWSTVFNAFKNILSNQMLYSYNDDAYSNSKKYMFNYESVRFYDLSLIENRQCQLKGPENKVVYPTFGCPLFYQAIIEVMSNFENTKLEFEMVKSQNDIFIPVLEVKFNVHECNNNDCAKQSVIEPSKIFHLFFIPPDCIVDSKGMINTGTSCFLEQIQIFLQLEGFCNNLGNHENNFAQPLNVAIIPFSILINVLPVESEDIRRKTHVSDTGFLNQFGIAAALNKYKASIFMDLDIVETQTFENLKRAYSTYISPNQEILMDTYTPLIDGSIETCHIDFRDLLFNKYNPRWNRKSVNKFIIAPKHGSPHFLDAFLFWLTFKFCSKNSTAKDHDDLILATNDKRAHWNVSAVIITDRDIQLPSCNKEREGEEDNSERFEVFLGQELSFDFTLQDDYIDIELVALNKF